MPLRAIHTSRAFEDFVCAPSNNMGEIFLGTADAYHRASTPPGLRISVPAGPFVPPGTRDAALPGRLWTGGATGQGRRSVLCAMVTEADTLRPPMYRPKQRSSATPDGPSPNE